MQNIYLYLCNTVLILSKSEFRNKFIIKGGTALMSMLLECNRQDLFRLTSDIDIHCDSKKCWYSFINRLEDILNRNNEGYKYKVLEIRSKTRGSLDNSDSVKLSLFDSVNNIEVQFKIDMNIKNSAIITTSFSPILNMATYDCLTMLADKIVVVSSDKIYRRVKDLYDICVLASISNFTLNDIISHIKVKHPNCDLKNMLVDSNFSKVEHAFSRFTGIFNKPDIRILVAFCSIFLEPIYSRKETNLIWDSQKVLWKIS